MGDLKYNLTKLGLRWFETDAKIDLAELILEIIESKNLRFIKAIPFLIWQNQTNQQSNLDLEELYTLASKSKLQLEIAFILKITINIFEKEKNLLYKELRLNLRKYLPKQKLSLLEKEDKKYLSFLNFKINSFTDFFEECYQEFLTQKKLLELEKKEYLQENIIKSKELDLRFAISKLFKPKQREIITKILDSKTLTKTEYEYYIRIIKKKLDAIKQLKELSETVLQKNILRK